MKSVKNVNGTLSATMNDDIIKAIETVIAKGDTAQVTPSPGGGIKVIHIQRRIILDTGNKTK